MRYFFIETQELSDGTGAQAIYAKDTPGEAAAAFHASLAYAMQGTAVQRTMCMVADSDGCVYRKEVWERD